MAVVPYDNFTDNTYRLGGYLPLDGRISWAPKMPGRVQPLSCYIVREGGRAHLIDTGAACHRDLILDQLGQVLPEAEGLTTFTTRNEYQCVGNITVISKVRRLEELYFFGINPFAAYDDISSGMPDVRVVVLDVSSKKPLPLAGAPNISIISSPIRILSTFWAYNSRTKTLFSSDWFGHTSTRVEQPSAVIDDLADDDTTYEMASSAINMRYHWLRLADTSMMSEWLEQVFQEFEVENIAPTFGCVLKGRGVVQKHFDLSMDVLKKSGR